MKVFVGNFIHSISFNQIEIQSGIIVVNDSGIITDIIRSSSLDALRNVLNQHVEYPEIIIMNKDQFLIPGLIDSHFHAPQIVNLGHGYDLPLLDWLNKYTFPREAEFENTEHATNIYTKLINNLLKQGTTTVSYYSTIHLEATKILANCMIKQGQRGFVGKVCMDRNGTDYYVESYDSCIKNNIEIIDYLKDSKLVKPIITPRFAITCTANLMQSLGDLAEKHNLPIQTHLSENKNEIQTVEQLFPGLNYTQVYEKYNLLNKKSVMAHCVHLTPTEIDLVKQHNVGISHCPTSNINIMSGLLDVKPLCECGIKVGLGSDVSGGNTCSMMRVINEAVNISKIVNKQPMNFEQGFYLATLGNAQVLNLEDKIGNFVVGKCFDALLIDTNSNDGLLFIHPNDTIRDKFEKFIYSGDDRNILKVYVDGKLVFSKL